MTDRQANRLLKQALPCPFCGEDLVVHSDHHGCWLAHKEEPGVCLIDVVQVLDEDDLSRWNTRDGVEHVVQTRRQRA